MTITPGSATMVTANPYECQGQAPFGFIRSHRATNRTAPRSPVCRPPAPIPSHASGPSVAAPPGHCPGPAWQAAVCAPPPGPPRRPGSARRAPPRAVPRPSTRPSPTACAPVHTSPVNRSVPPLSRSPRRLRTQSANIVCSSSCSPRSQSTSSGFSGRNGSSRDLDVPGGVEPPLHPEPLDQPVQPEALADHPDRARRSRWRARRSRRPRRPASSRRRRPRPRRTRAPAPRASSAKPRIRSATRADWVGDPPGELICSPTATRPSGANARSRVFSTTAALITDRGHRPGRPG